MSTLEFILSVFVAILIAGILALDHRRETWRSIAQKLKEDYELLADKFESKKELTDYNLTWLAKWMQRAKSAETAYAEQSKRMSVIVAENQKLRRSNAQLISHRGLRGKE